MTRIAEIPTILPAHDDDRTGIAIVSFEGRLLELSPEIAPIFQTDLSALRNLTFHELSHPDDLLRDEVLFEKLLEEGTGSYSMLKRYRRARGDYIWTELDVTLMCDTRGAPSHFVSRIRPTDIRNETLDTLHDRVTHDPLTRLLNRTMILEQVATAVRRGRRLGQGFGLIMLDLNGFKAINDSHGHEAGDLLLARVAQRLRAALDTPDLIGRLGGDEFAVILRGTGDEQALRHRQKKIAACFEQPFTPLYPGHAVDLGASIGAASYPRDGATPSELLRHADQAMYDCKRAGRSA